LTTVLNGLKLALLLGAAAIYLLGQGWLGFKLVSKDNGTKNEMLLQVIPLVLACGMISNLAIVLLFQQIKIALLVGCMLSAIGIYFFFRDIILTRNRPVFSSGSIYQWLGAAVVCLLFLGPILAYPLKDWDARSIWFFHARMIYIAGTIGQSAGWQDPSIVFSHPDYPLLVPVLAAQIATVTGFWNEFLPKVSLFFVLVPPILWLFTFARKSIGFVVLLLLIPFTFYRWMWNGYMDAYLAMYFATALLLLGRYIQSSQKIDLISGLCCLVILLYLKNEGALALLAGVVSLFWILLLKKSTTSWSPLKVDRRYYLAGLLAVLPFLLWTIYKGHWNVSNDLEIGTSQSISRIVSRIEDGSYQLIFERIFEKTEAGLLFLVLVYFAASWKNKSSREAIPALLAAGIYCLGLITIYLLTPSRLERHIGTAGRTMLTVNAAIFVACYFLISALESKKVPDQGAE
jgi:hypothetical protein